MRNVNVALWGFGAMASGIARVLLEKEGVTVVGANLAPDFEVLDCASEYTFDSGEVDGVTFTSLSKSLPGP